MKKILLTMGETRNLSTYPSVVNTANLLSYHGYHIDIFCSENVETDVKFEADNIKILRFKRTKPAILGMLLSLYKAVKSYDLVISFHAGDFIASGAISELFKIPYIYFCLEIVGFDEIKSIKSKIKKYLEIYFNRKASITIVQDETREKMIRKVHRIPHKMIIHIPNSYVGVVKSKSNYLREKFGISDNKIIVLYVGALQKWAIDEALITSLENWGDNIRLVLHGFSSDGYINHLQPIIDSINNKEKKVYVSMGILPDIEFQDLLSSADIGLVWYKSDTSLNVKTIGKSSGKFSAFLRCGIPVIVPSYLNFGHVVEENNIGVMIDREEFIGKAIEKIMSKYKFYRNNCFRFYCKNLDFVKFFTFFLKKLDKILY